MHHFCGWRSAAMSCSKQDVFIMMFHSFFLFLFNFNSLSLMLWSQIKLLPYDFSDLQITGAFEMGTRQFKLIFLAWSHIWRRPESVYDNTGQFYTDETNPAAFQTVPGQSPLILDDIYFKQYCLVPFWCVEMPAGCPWHFTLKWPYKTLYGCHEILSSTWTSSGTVQCLKIKLK